MSNNNSSDYILAEDGSNLTSIIKILNIVCYFIALILALFVLNISLNAPSPIVSILVFIVGTLSLEQDSLYWILSLVKRKVNPINGVTKSSKLLPINFKWYIYGLIGFRFILFNSLYKMFPLFLVSIPIIIVGVIVGCVEFSITGVGILTLVEVLLGLFRYYVSSKQETTMKVINEIHGTLNNIVVSTITPISFIDSVNLRFKLKTEDINFMQSRYKNEEYIDNYLDKLSKLLKENNLNKQIRISKENILFTIPQQAYVDAPTFFSNLEKSYLNSGKKPRLPEMYEYYFLDYCLTKIYNEIKIGYDFREMGRIILANINLLDDCQSILVKFSRFNQMWELLGGEKISNTEYISASRTSKTHSEYINEVIYRVYQSITQEMYGDFIMKESEDNKKNK